MPAIELGPRFFRSTRATAAPAVTGQEVPVALCHQGGEQAVTPPRLTMP